MWNTVSILLRGGNLNWHQTPLRCWGCGFEILTPSRREGAGLDKILHYDTVTNPPQTLRVRVWTLTPSKIKGAGSNPPQDVRVRVQTPLKMWGRGYTPLKTWGCGYTPLKMWGCGYTMLRQTTHYFWWSKNEISLKQKIEKYPKNGHSTKTNLDTVPKITLIKYIWTQCQIFDIWTKCQKIWTKCQKSVNHKRRHSDYT